jgi:hypothetical protein
VALSILMALNGASRNLRPSKPLTCCAAGLVIKTVLFWAIAEALASSSAWQVNFGKWCAIAFSFNEMAGRLDHSTCVGN